MGWKNIRKTPKWSLLYTKKNVMEATYEVI